MSHRDTRQSIKLAQLLLQGHYSGDPEHELSLERIQALQDTIEQAERYLQDEPDDFEPSYRKDEK